MSIVKDFDVSGFIKDGKLLLENLRIENSRIVGLELYNVRLVSIVNCILKDVTFQNYISYGVTIMQSTFVDCRFHDTIHDDKSYDGVLAIWNSAFTDCFFDDISVYVCEESAIVGCYFWNCTFKNVNVVGGIETIDSFWGGGRMDALTYKVIFIDGCKFYNMKMLNMDVGTALRCNRFENIMFKNVTVMGTNEKNQFVNCDTDGFTFVEDDRWD